MNSDDSKYDKYDMNHIIIKPLYFGLMVNIMIPMGLLLVCYYLTNNNLYTAQVGFDMANSLFYIFGFLAVLIGSVALLWRQKMMSQPMISSNDRFEDDLTAQLNLRIRPIMILIATISLLGFIYFILTARFKEMVFLIFFSFIVFQVVRPRIGFIKRLIDSQKQLVEQGQFRKN